MKFKQLLQLILFPISVLMVYSIATRVFEELAQEIKNPDSDFWNDDDCGYC